MIEVDAAFGLAFLDIKVAFEIVVLPIFGEFPKTAELNRDFGFGSPMEAVGASKTNVGASEIGPGILGRRTKIRRVVKARLDKIGGPSKVRPEKFASPWKRA